MESLHKTWQLQEAKARFSEVFERAIADGPQRITRHGKLAAYLISELDYDRLVSSSGPGETLLSFLMNSPLWGSGVAIERVEGYAREADLE